MKNLPMVPRDRKFSGTLDTAEPTCTIVHQQANADGLAAKSGEHSPVVCDGLRRETMESVGQVLVNLLGCKVGGGPVEPPAQDGHLVDVPVAGSYAAAVGNGKLGKGHWSDLSRLEISACKRMDYATSRSSARSSGVYSTLYGVVAWGVLRDHKILRLAFLAALTTALWLNRMGLVCTLLVLGQFGESLRELFPKDGG
jgi:hypothetical protein